MGKFYKSKESKLFIVQVLLVVILLILIKYSINHSETEIIELKNKSKLASTAMLLAEINLVAFFSRAFDKPILIRINLILVVLYFIYFLSDYFNLLPSV